MIETQSAPKVEWRSLAEWREHLGYTQEEFAELMNVHQTAVSQLESGKKAFNSRVGRRALWTLENLGVDRDLVDTQAGIRSRREAVDEGAVWVEDGFRATTPKRTLVEWRNSRHLSQGDLSALTGLNEQTISRIERGVHPTKAKTRQKLAKALRVRQNKLILPGDDEPTEIEISLEKALRAELRDARHALRKAYDFMRDDSNVTFKAQTSRDGLLPEIQREMKR